MFNPGKSKRMITGTYFTLLASKQNSAVADSLEVEGHYEDTITFHGVCRQCAPALSIFTIHGFRRQLPCWRHFIVTLNLQRITHLRSLLSFV